jgi:hypothetical protein
VLLIAAHVLSDIKRWWIGNETRFADQLQIGDIYQLLHQTTVEAEAMWSLLSEREDGTRTFTATTALVPITVQLFSRGGDLIVWDVRIHPTG